jgi:hypothetical protein
MIYSCNFSAQFSQHVAHREARVKLHSIYSVAPNSTKIDYQLAAKSEACKVFNPVSTLESLTDESKMMQLSDDNRFYGFFSHKNAATQLNSGTLYENPGI